MTKRQKKDAQEIMKEGHTYEQARLFQARDKRALRRLRRVWRDSVKPHKGVKLLDARWLVARF